MQCGIAARQAHVHSRLTYDYNCLHAVYNRTPETAGIPRSGTRTVSARQARVHSRLMYDYSYLYAVYIIPHFHGKRKLLF